MNSVSISQEDAQTAHQSTASDYFELLKPRVMSLVVFSAIAGVVMAPGVLHPYLAFMSVFMIALGAGASGALNMWYDRDIDAIMTRTQKRPLPLGKITPDDALFFGRRELSNDVTRKTANQNDLLSNALSVQSILHPLQCYHLALPSLFQQVIQPDLLHLLF